MWEKGNFLSGAGPTLIAVVRNVVSFRRERVDFLAGMEDNWQVQMLPGRLRWC